MLNLVTAVIVENAFSDSKSEDLELAVRLEREKEEELEDLTLGSHDNYIRCKYIYVSYILYQCTMTYNYT